MVCSMNERYRFTPTVFSWTEFELKRLPAVQHHTQISDLGTRSIQDYALKCIR